MKCGAAGLTQRPHKKERTSLVWGFPLMKGLLLFLFLGWRDRTGAELAGSHGQCLGWSACLRVLCADWMMEDGRGLVWGSEEAMGLSRGKHCGKISLPFREKGWERLLKGLWTPVGASTCILASERVLLSLLSFFPAGCGTARNRRRGWRRTHRFHV